MTKEDVIDKLIQNENFAFSDADRVHLSGLPEDVLKRLYLTSTTPQVSITNSDSELQKKASELESVRTEIKTLREKERQLCQVLSQSGVAVSYIANESAGVSDESISEFVKTSQSSLAVVLRESLDIRNQDRRVLVDKIISNNAGLFSHDELLLKSSDELRKLAVLSDKSSQNRSSQPLNWQGAGMADLTITNDSFDTIGLLELPTTF